MIQLSHVSKIFAPGHRALTDVSLEIGAGEFVFVYGVNGAGKSTLLRLLFREDEPSEGQILVDGQKLAGLGSRGVARLRRKIGLVFQEFKLLPALSALDNVALAAQIAGASKKQSQIRAYQLLRDCGLHERYEAKPCSLSGGERQRIAIARALINDPSLILADEPTGNIDDQTAGDLMDLLMRTGERGATVLVATHNRSLTQRHGNRVITLQHGCLINDSADPPLPKLEFRW